MAKLSSAQLAAVMAEVLQTYGSKNQLELGSRGVPVTKKEWRQTYDIAGVPWEDCEEQKLH